MKSSWLRSASHEPDSLESDKGLLLAAAAAAGDSCCSARAPPDADAENDEDECERSSGRGETAWSDGWRAAENMASGSCRAQDVDMNQSQQNRFSEMQKERPNPL
jgi:hypothetical protein